MTIETRAGLAAQAVAEARKLHTDTNPALLVLPVEGGSEDFLRWIAERTAGAGWDLAASGPVRAFALAPLDTACPRRASCC